MDYIKVREEIKEEIRHEKVLRIDAKEQKHHYRIRAIDIRLTKLKAMLRDINSLIGGETDV